MKPLLRALFEKRYPGGTVICCRIERPTDSFSITVLFGPSGCGKSTILRCLAGLERPELGRITLGAAIWFDAAKKTQLSPQDRGIGYLFQDYALFPHLTVAGNIGFGLTGTPRAERQVRVARMLQSFELDGLEDRYPHQVSGGQQQRIALARVLIRRPQLLLLDEPLSALDESTRQALRPRLRKMLASFGVPVILVTHDRVEAMALADHLVILNEGRILQEGTGPEVFSRPADVTVARIVGTETVQPGRIVGVHDGLATVAVGAAQLVALAPQAGRGDVFVCIRGEDVVLQGDGAQASSARNRLKCRVQSLAAEGPMVRVGLDSGFPLTALVTRPACDELCLCEGAAVTALVKAPAVHLIARE